MNNVIKSSLRCNCCGHEGGCHNCGVFGGGKLETFNYLDDVPPVSGEDFEWVEVHFKNTRKGFYQNSQSLVLSKGDLVAVEATPGHDIGTVSMTGKLVQRQMTKMGYNPHKTTPLKVFRIAKTNDIERFEEAKEREEATMIRSREIAKDLSLDMKIGDVEYQGDGLKAIFYYISDQRVDFRQLIKRLADEFHIRVEMRQIGARQEAGRIGGIGPCGRQLCCSGWMTHFMSVGTNAARLQDLSMNPQKLAGQCAKLKCCLNYEVDVYEEAQKNMPPRDINLKTSVGDYRLFKTDALAQRVTYVPLGKRKDQEEFVVITAQRAFEILALNQQNELPFDLKQDNESTQNQKDKRKDKDILLESSLTRFDQPNPKKRPKNIRSTQSSSQPHKRKYRGSNQSLHSTSSKNSDK